MLVAQSCLTLCDPVDTPGAHQAPLSMEFSRQEYWSGLLVSSPGDLPDSGIKPRSPATQADSLPLSHLGSPRFKIANKAISFSRGSPNPGTEPGSLALQADFLLSELQKSQGQVCSNPNRLVGKKGHIWNQHILTLTIRLTVFKLKKKISFQIITH